MENNPYDYNWEDQHDNKETHPRMGKLLTLDLKHGPQCDRCNRSIVGKIEYATRVDHFNKGGTD
jgi:hypothetical protein